MTCLSNTRQHVPLQIFRIPSKQESSKGHETQREPPKKIHNIRIKGPQSLDWTSDTRKLSTTYVSYPLIRASGQRPVVHPRFCLLNFRICNLSFCMRANSNRRRLAHASCLSWLEPFQKRRPTNLFMAEPIRSLKLGSENGEEKTYVPCQISKDKTYIFNSDTSSSAYA